MSEFSDDFVGEAIDTALKGSTLFKKLVVDTHEGRPDDVGRLFEVAGEIVGGVLKFVQERGAGEATPPKLRKLEGWVEERVEWLRPLKDPSAVLVNLERDVHRLRPNTYIDFHGQEFILTHHDVWVDDAPRTEIDRLQRLADNEREGT